MMVHDRKVIGVLIEEEHIVPGFRGTVKIEYHTPSGEGDKHYCDVFTDAGTVRRIFNFCEIGFDKEDAE